MNAKTVQKLDANESIFFKRELEHVKAQTYDVKYPELKARSIFPVSFEAGNAAESIVYEQYDQVGMAKIIANYASDFPRADVRGKEFTAIVKSLGASYGYNLQEIRAAAKAGKPLQMKKANAAKRAILAKENAIAFSGDAANNLPGFLTNSNIPVVTLAADGSGSSKLWSTKTGKQIARDVAAVFTAINTVSKQVENADTLLLPPAKYNYIASTPFSDYTEKTILKWILENITTIKAVEWCNELTGAGSGSTDRLVAYTRNPEKLTLEIPSDFEQFPEQEEGLEYKIHCHQRIAGVLVYYPLSIAFADGF